MKIPTIILLLLTVLFVAEEAFSADCTISGNKVVNYAYQTGHSFTIISNQGCSVYIGTNKENCSAIRSDIEIDNNKCTYVLFNSTKLKNGWTFKSANYGGTNFVIKLPPRGSTSLTMKVILTPSEGRSATFYLKNITLLGPTCPNWKDAF